MWPFYSFQAELGSFVSVRIPFRIPLCSVPDAFITCFMERVTSAMVVERIASRCGSQSGIYFITCFGGGGGYTVFFQVGATRRQTQTAVPVLSSLLPVPRPLLPTATPTARRNQALDSGSSSLHFLPRVYPLTPASFLHRKGSPRDVLLCTSLFST